MPAPAQKKPITEATTKGKRRAVNASAVGYLGRALSQADSPHRTPKVLQFSRADGQSSDLYDMPRRLRRGRRWLRSRTIARLPSRTMPGSGGRTSVSVGDAVADR